MATTHGSQAYLAAVRSVIGVVEHITDDTLHAPGLGEWDVSGLAGHLLRALITPVEYLAKPDPIDPIIPGAAGYALRYLMSLEVDRTQTAAMVAHRGDAQLAGKNARKVVAEFRRAADAVSDLVAVTPPGQPVEGPYGTMTLADYLRTRNLEVVIHGLDLARALGIDWTPPKESANDAFALLGEIAVDRGLANNVLLALTGRAGVPIEPVLT